MISGDAYQYIYLVIVAIFTFIQIVNLKRSNGHLKESPLPGHLLLLFLILYIGVRPYTDDTIGIAEYSYLNWGYPFHFDLLAENLIFDNLYGLSHLLAPHAQLWSDNLQILLCAFH